jgi:hypothetical protein
MPETCPYCHGTGWRRVFLDDGYDYSGRCDCDHKPPQEPESDRKTWSAGEHDA